MSEHEEGPGAGLWAEAAGGEALERYRTLANAIDDGIYQLDPEGRFVAVNDVVVERTGYDRAELLGEHVSMLLAEEDVGRIRSVVRSLLSSDDDAEMVEASVRTADGGRIDCEVRLSLLVTDGEFRGTVGVARDVTERRRREREARRERALLNRVFDASPVGIAVLAPDGELLTLNDRAAEIVGVDPAGGVPDAYEASEWTAYDADGDPIPPEERTFGRVVETGEPVFDVESKVERVDSGWVWLSSNGVPVFDDGELALVIVTYEDVTERKENERQLRCERAQTEKLLKTAPVGVVVHDADGEAILANERAEDFLGLSEAEILDGRREVTLFDADGDALPREATPSARAFESGAAVYDEEVLVERSDGRRRWFRLNAAPVFDSEGSLERVITAGEDVTELKRRERQLERRKNELETELGEIFGRISDAFFALDDEFRFTHVNERAEELLRRSEGELLGERVADAFPLTDGVRDAFETAMETQTPAEIERYSDPLGFWVEASIYPSETGLSVYFRDVSERKERERELMQYEALVETVDDGIYVLDDDGRFALVNEAYAEMAGYRREELVGEHASLVVDEDVLRRADRKRAEMRDSAPTRPTFEGELTTKSGDRVPVEATFAALPDDAGGERRIGIIRDVTERKAGERALEESERRYRTLVENLPNGAVGLFDEDLRYTVAGGEIFDALDTSREDVVGATVYERYPPDVVADVEPHFRAVFEGEATTFETELRGRHLFAHTLPVRNAAGDIFAGMLVTQDITERRGQERRLREREQRLERYKEYTDDVLDAIDDVFFIIDADGNLRRWNESLCEVSGYSDEEVRSMHASAFFDSESEDPAVIAEAIRRGFETGHARVQADVLTKDGDSLTFEFYGAALEDPDGDPILAGIGRDISERKEAQRQLEESNERLEQFAYAASHDLQEPLRMVSSYLNLIERRYADRLDEDGEEFIEFAVDGAERMRDMIDALLTYSRVETRGDKFECVDVDSVVEDVRKNLELKITETGADVTVESLPRVYGDRRQLRQVFQNLLNNALEYCGDDSPRVHVRAEREESAWRFAVSDAGIGIEPEHRERIFEVFQRLHTCDEHAGTGIGLALSQRIVERHGGRIWVDSDPGEGSTFYFTVPDAEGRRA